MWTWRAQAEHAGAEPRERARAIAAIAVLALISAGAGCGRDNGAGQKAPSPAKVEKPVKEIDINTITLTPEAEARLGLRTVAAARKKLQRTRTLGGEAIVPPGLGVTVAAPLGGTLSLAGAALRPGAAVDKGQPLFTLVPAVTERVRFAESKASLGALRADADAAVAKAKIDLEAAKIALDRAEKLAQENVGSAERLDTARAQAKLAEASLAAAEARRYALIKAIASEAGSSAPITLEAPMSGVLLRVNVHEGQVVAAGAPLFDVVKIDAIWIKVPVYVGDLAGVDAAKEALIGTLTNAPDQSLRVAKPVAAPPLANPTSATVDLFYELDNAAASLRPGESVSVTLPLKGEEESLAVPWSSVVHDIYGGTWVYENTAPHVYARRRVQVRHVVGGLAALASGPKAGASIVTDGAAELFGTELGTGK